MSKLKSGSYSLTIPYIIVTLLFAPITDNTLDYQTFYSNILPFIVIFKIAVALRYYFGGKSCKLLTQLEIRRPNEDFYRFAVHVVTSAISLCKLQISTVLLYMSVTSTISVM